MNVMVRQIHPVLMDGVSGRCIWLPLDTAIVTTLQWAINRYAVLVFRGSDEQQIGFTDVAPDGRAAVRPRDSCSCGVQGSHRPFRIFCHWSDAHACSP